VLKPLTVISRELRISPERLRRAFHSGAMLGEVVAGRILLDLASARRWAAEGKTEQPGEAA